MTFVPWVASSPDATFVTKTDVDVWLSVQGVEIVNVSWINPDDGKILLAD